MGIDHIGVNHIFDFFEYFIGKDVQTRVGNINRSKVEFFRVEFRLRLQ
jgi:hypothetical protein